MKELYHMQCRKKTTGWLSGGNRTLEPTCWLEGSDERALSLAVSTAFQIGVVVVTVL